MTLETDKSVVNYEMQFFLFGISSLFPARNSSVFISIKKNYTKARNQEDFLDALFAIACKLCLQRTIAFSNSTFGFTGAIIAE